MQKKENEVGYFNYLINTYGGITQLIASTKQRLLSLPGEHPEAEFDSMLKGERNAEGLETVKGRLTRAIEHELKQWDVWELWLKKIPGIGPAIGGQLIMLYYYRHLPICKKCKGDLKKEDGVLICTKCQTVAKEGLLSYRLDYKNFTTISKWWAYMGRHTVDGTMPKRKKGTQINWSTIGRTLGFHIGDQFNRQADDHPYKAFFLERKKRHQKKHPEWTKGHVHNAARNETVKLFLAHFWTVARTLEGLSVSEPYAGAIMGHTNIIDPFYYEMPVVVKRLMRATG